ncbi:DHA2 family efflux MFS transporter permease subunit [Limnobacter humi]|uniref:DHA2 family efflux MFS transporter permease subunit n=1 Tax=Limnobacter humi TaxID=1778671 RepID=A0ABT1WE44_9BURK|nr:DHA2 family efflux MFS transporter permease subunit [Limnobacter humi]
MALFILGFGTVAGVLCTSSFNVAVPALSAHFQLGQSQIQWAMTGFLAAMTVGMLPTSWLLDRLGFRVVFLGALLVLTAASFTGFFASSFTVVVLARVFQGLATGVLQPMGTMALMRLIPAEMQGRASGILTFSIALTPAIAPSFGGLLLDHFGWPSIFLLGLPFALASGLAAIFLLPAPREIKHNAFDWTGLCWLTVATLALVESVSSLQHSGLLSCRFAAPVMVALGAAALYRRHALRNSAPIISLGLFGERTFSMGTVVSFSYGFGLYASTYLIPVFLQHALGYSASDAGIALVPSGIALVLMLPLAGRMADHYPPKWITVLGLAVFGSSFAMFALQATHMPYGQIIAATVIGRIGLGMILPALSLATLRHLDSAQLGQSSVVFSYARQLGGVMGVAVVAVLVDWRESLYAAHHQGVAMAYAQGFLFLAVVFGLSCFAALQMQAHRVRASQ